MLLLLCILVLPRWSMPTRARMGMLPPCELVHPGPKGFLNAVPQSIAFGYHSAHWCSCGHVSSVSAHWVLQSRWDRGKEHIITAMAPSSSSTADIHMVVNILIIRMLIAQPLSTPLVAWKNVPNAPLRLKALCSC